VAESRVKTSPPVPAELLAHLLPIVREINAVLDVDALLPAIAEQLRQILDYRILDIFLPQPDGSLVPGLVVGYSKQQADRIRLLPGQGIVGEAAARQEPVFVPDVTRDPRYVPAVPGVVAELAIPLLHRDRLVGVLNIEGPDVEAFTPEAQTALRVLAGHLAVAIENAALYRESRSYADLLATLYEIGRETASILDLDQLLHRVAELTKKLIDYEMFGILLLDAERGELVLRESVRYCPSKAKTRIPLGQGLCGAAALTKQPILVGDVRRDPRYLNLVPETRSELVVPLVHKDRVVGVFDLESRELDRFTLEHVKILTPLASQVAAAIENARLYEELRARERRLLEEMAIARKVQRGLFPEDCPRGAGWEASAHFRPAREVGGDLYDFYELGAGRLGVSVGDVAGKGVPAALYGAFASGAVRARAFEALRPSELMYRVNQTLRRRGIEGLFCTLTYAVFDLGARRLRLANSGLPYPLHYRAATGACAPIQIGGLPLGAFEGSAYDEGGFDLAAGDVFAFYTDGLTEAWDGEREYGGERLRRLVERHAGLGAPEIGDAVMRDFDAFLGGGVPADDVTLVIVRLL
jgi:phosphoserine phosphatase RsbU/P